METDKQAVKDTGNMGYISASLGVATLKRGTKFRYKGYLCHVLCVCDDNDTTLIIVKKYYGKYRKWWHYDIMEADRFEELVGNGRITKAK